MIGAMVLIGIWLLGRVMEAMHGNTVFDPILTIWLSVSIFTLLTIWIIGSGIASAKNMMQGERRWRAVVSWILFLIIILSILFYFEGFRTSSSGLFGAISGSTDSTKQAVFLLFKYHPANPMLAVNLLASKLTGALDIESLIPYVWNSNLVFAFFIWSFGYSILLLMNKNEIWPKSIHLFFSACGLGVIILLKAMSSITNEQMVLLHTAAAMLFIFQALLTYAFLRAFAGRRVEIAAESIASDSFSKEENPGDEKAMPGIPPSSLKIVLCLFIVLPILADLQTQFILAPSSAQVMNEIANGQTQAGSELITATRISVYAGPAVGNDIVGVLPEGTRVPIADKKYGWVSIGKNRWISEKFLRPPTIKPRPS